MKEKIQDIIKRYERKGDFLYTHPDDNLIKEAEARLGVKLPEEFKWFLHEYGYGGIGSNILGVGYDGKCMFEEVTIEYRKYGLKENYVAIENCDEWLYCIDTDNGKVVMWFMDDEDVEAAYDNFLEYFLDQLNDAIENL